MSTEIETSLSSNLCLEDSWRQSLLLDPSKITNLHLAGGKPDIQFQSLRITIGDRPLARNLASLYSASGKALPADFLAFSAAYRLYLVTATVGVLEEHRGRPLDQIGFKIQYSDAPEARVSIVDVLPQSRFVTLVGTELSCTTDVSLDGHAELPDELAKLLSGAEPISAAAKITLSAKAGIVGRIRFSVVTPVIQAMGQASGTAEWILRRDSKPLVGTHTFSHVLLAPKHLADSNLTAFAFVTATVGGFLRVPVPLNSPSVGLTVDLTTADESARDREGDDHLGERRFELGATEPPALTASA